MPNYLDEEEDDSDYLNPAVGLGPLPLAPRYSPPIATPPFLPGSTPVIQAPATPSGLPPLDPIKTIEARGRLRDINMQQPQQPKPKWWQSLAAGAIGGLAGYANAGGQVNINPKAAIGGVLNPGGARRESNWQRKQEQAAADVALEDANLKTIEGARKAASEEDYKKAETERAKKQGSYYEGRIAAGEQANKDRIAEQDKARQTRAFGELTKGLPVVYRREGEPPPEGWQQIPLSHPDMVGMVAYAPPPIAPVPAELVPYLPGHKQGEMVDRNLLNDASKTYRSELEKRNVQGAKPDKEVANPSQVLLNPGNYTPAQVETAKRLFAQEHRNPNDAGAVNPPPPRNPALAPNQRDEGLLASQDAGTQAVIRQLVDYKYQLPTGIALSKPYWTNMLQLAAQYDPSFDASQYQVRQKMRADFTSGKTAAAINSLNTVTQHVDQLEKNWAKLNNIGGMGTALNAPLNWAGGHLSGDLQNRLNRYQLDQEAVANELMRVWRQVGASESEIKSWAAKLSPNLSPEAQRGAIQEIMELIKGKLIALKSQYETGMGRPADFHMLQPETLKRFQKHGVEAEDLVPGATYGAPPPTLGAPGTPAGRPPLSAFEH